MKTIVCRCEDIDENEVRELIREGYHSITEIKRILRVGMGHCQGRTCGRLVAQIIREETGKPLDKIELPTTRPPIKPVPLKVLARR